MTIYNRNFVIPFLLAATLSTSAMAQRGGGGGGGGGDRGPRGPDGPRGPRGPGGPSPPPPPPPPLQLSGVRSIDGSETPGSTAGALLSRMSGIADYPDGTGTGMHTEPNARAISDAVNDQPREVFASSQASDMLYIWGQFLDHDIDLSDHSTDLLDETSIVNPLCNDMNPNMPDLCVIPFTRSAYQIVGGQREQINSITSFIDASMVYGSDAAREQALRAPRGRLAMGANGMLPFNVNELANAALPTNVPTNLYLAGDIRANEQVGLTAMHTLFVREHNRLVEELDQHFPNSSDEDLYQMARKIVGAEIQVITYKEFLPKLLGGAAPDLNQYSHNPNADASIANEFSTVAFRVGHTMLSSTFHTGLSLVDAFFVPTMLSANNMMESLLSGFYLQQAQEVDTLVIDEVRNFLFGNANGGVGHDLVSLNIQRGRDHGIPRYNELRNAFGLGVAASFADITNDVAVQEALALAYDDDVNLVDAWIGGLAEPHVNGGMVGRLFSHIISDQFTRLMEADPFFYKRDNDLDNSHLKDHVIDIERVNLSDIIRWNTALLTDHDQNVMTYVPPSM